MEWEKISAIIAILSFVYTIFTDWPVLKKRLRKMFPSVETIAFLMSVLGFIGMFYFHPVRSHLFSENSNYYLVGTNITMIAVFSYPLYRVKDSFAQAEDEQKKKLKISFVAITFIILVMTGTTIFTLLSGS